MISGNSDDVAPHQNYLDMLEMLQRIKKDLPAAPAEP
jgi:hypothetical protein